MTEYVPELATVVVTIFGFCKVDVKLFGPDHIKEEPIVLLAVRERTALSQMGLLFVTTGAVGKGFTVTEVTLV